MPLNIPDGSFNATAKMAVDGSIKVFTCALGGSYIGTGSRSASEIAEEWNDLFIQNSRPFDNNNMTNDYTWLGMDVVLMDDGLPIIGSFSANISGANTGDCLPPNCSILVKKTTAAGGRKNRGRLFQPPFCLNENQVDAAGFLIGSNREEQQNGWDYLLADIYAADYFPLLFHNDSTSPTAITALTVSGQIATQRRRLR